MPASRPYRGVDADARRAERRLRFLEAGLDLLGHTDPDELTVRAICAESGLTARYFYENFTDKDALVEAVFDNVTAQLATTTQAAVAAAPPEEQNRAGISNIIGMIAADPRIGRLLFSTEVAGATLVRKRAEQGELFTALSGQHIQAALKVGGNDRIQGTASFVVGGVRQTITAWLAGDLTIGTDDLVDLLVGILDVFNEPRLFSKLIG